MSMRDNDLNAVGIAIGAQNDIKRLSEYIHSDRFIDDLLMKMYDREKELLVDSKYKSMYSAKVKDFKDLGKRFDIAMKIIQKDESLLEEYMEACATADGYSNLK